MCRPDQSGKVISNFYIHVRSSLCENFNRLEFALLGGFYKDESGASTAFDRDAANEKKQVKYENGDMLIAKRKKCPHMHSFILPEEEDAHAIDNPAQSRGGAERKIHCLAIVQGGCHPSPADLYSAIGSFAGRSSRPLLLSQLTAITGWKPQGETSEIE
jgi:hypothetical protein